MINKMVSLLLVAVLKSMSVDTENTYHVSADVDKIDTLSVDVVTKQWNNRGHETTIQRVDYIVRNSVAGLKFNEPLLLC